MTEVQDRPASAVDDRALSELHDLFHAGRGQDFATDAAVLSEVVLARYPRATSLLDVGCGTGEHLRALARFFHEVVGLEPVPAMCDVARAKLPGVQIHHGDPRTFDLGRTFDAICCLAGTIGQMSTIDELVGVLRTMAWHLEPGGVLAIDPYWSPENHPDGQVAHHAVRDRDRTVVRLSRSTRRGDAVRHDAHYLVADRTGIRHLTHTQPLTLFTRSEYLSALEAADCTAEQLPAAGGFAARGLIVGIRRH
ncbi:MAG TPA: methyltransferase domain-containing protein [Actinophytocola sp.]|uniref:class I SAM-dependent methyltransferase n=1 Tax=Actinophytocola sp. TaxID=1872138 RepID=UPI002DBA187B|nr:methyltransferase domain-containing protein [Actinophytocola sp.]HEU5475561.1 methyltransferase domain-containing protein [Actinophytocola sp.]